VISAAEEVIPRLQKAHPILARQPLDLAQLVSSKAPAIADPDGINPNLGDLALVLNVNVWRLATVCGIEEKPIGTAP
jgi:hypothetical protein